MGKGHQVGDERRRVVENNDLNPRFPPSGPNLLGLSVASRLSLVYPDLVPVEFSHSF